MEEDDGSLDGIVFRNIHKESTVDDMYGDVNSQDNGSCASDKSRDKAKDRIQIDQKNIVYDDAVDGHEIDNLNKDLLHLHNGLEDNVNNDNNKYNYIKQGGIINEQDGQGNHFSDANNNPQAQNGHFGGGNEIDQNIINNDNNNNDNDNKHQNQGGNNNNQVSDDDESYNDPNIYDGNSEDKQQNNHDSAGDWIMILKLKNLKMITLMDMKMMIIMIRMSSIKLRKRLF